MQNLEQAEYYSTLPLPDDSNLQPVGIDPDKPSWGGGIAFGYWLVSVALIAFIPFFFLLPYAMSQVPPVTEGNDLVEFAKNDKVAIILQLLGIIPAHLLTLLIGWLIVTRVRKDSFTEALGWKSGRTRWWFYPAIIVGFFCLAAVVSSIYPEQENDLIRMVQSSRAALFLIAFLATFTAPLVEELVYRGVMYSAFQKAAGKWPAFGLVTLLFASVHMLQYWPSYSTIAMIVLLSAVLTWLRIYSKNLWPCIVLHTIFNGLQSLGLIASSYVEKKDPAAEAAFIFTILK